MAFWLSLHSPAWHARDVGVPDYEQKNYNYKLSYKYSAVSVICYLVCFIYLRLIVVFEHILTLNTTFTQCEEMKKHQ